ncbi:hypothetical protein GGR52DRAFT_440552 [Hypoxylon sp. FL1284]|nr:hypothetical protein GGR52DRAFT_440552 [Hypoxylon sp. FL1284]
MPCPTSLLHVLVRTCQGELSLARDLAIDDVDPLELGDFIRSNGDTAGQFCTTHTGNGRAVNLFFFFLLLRRRSQSRHGTRCDLRVSPK